MSVHHSLQQHWIEHKQWNRSGRTPDSPSCAHACWDHGLFRILSSYWLAHFYLMKKSAKVLLYFGLDCGILYLQAAIPRTIVDSPVFLEHGSAEKIAVSGHTTRVPIKEDD
jgi:hypothetical protein